MGEDVPERADGGADELIGRVVSLALAEDLGEEGDITSRAIFTPQQTGAARVVTRQACVISGLEAAREVCHQVDPALSWLPLVEDGQQVPAAAEVARLEGHVVSILAAERTLLNFLSRLSGVATLTRSFVAALQGTATKAAATRKTMPGLRLLEKRAVMHGGGEPHRQGLYDAALIKDNHIAAAGSVERAISAAQRALGPGSDIEVEIDALGQLEEAIAAGATRVLLDNMTPDEVRACVEAAKGRVAIEASGGISLDNVRSYAEAGADLVSVGALTSSAPGIDFSLEAEASGGAGK